MQVDRGREKPAEGLRVISVTAVHRICILHRLEQLLSVHEVQEREGGRTGGETERWTQIETN